MNQPSSRVEAGPAAQSPAARPRPRLQSVRWQVIAPLLILSTMMNHLDRNVLAQSATVLKVDLHVDEQQLAHIVVCFQVVYMIMHLGAGRIIDQIAFFREATGPVTNVRIAYGCHSLANSCAPRSPTAGMAPRIVICS